MASVLQIASPDAIRRIRRVQADHNRMDECGGCGIAVGGLAGTESRSACIRWRQRHRTFLSGSSAVEISCKCAHEDAEKQAARVAGALLFVLAAFVATTSVAILFGL